MSQRRSSNWDEEEKTLLVECMKTGKLAILENKSVSAIQNCAKRNVWQEIQKEFQENGKSRNYLQIKQQWRKMKRESKLRITNFNKEKLATGGGVMKAPMPSTLDWTINEILPNEFVEDLSEFDSDVINNGKAYDGSEEEVEFQVDQKPGAFLTIAVAQQQPTAVPIKVKKEVEEVEEETTIEENMPLQQCTKKDNKSTNMTAYEENMFLVYKSKVELEMKHQTELHNLRMKYEKILYEKKIEKLDNFDDL